MKLKSFVLTTFLMIILADARGQIAGPIVNPANGHYYYLLEQSSWLNAEQTATNLGGHLVTITSSAENQWILDTFGNESRNLWIGLNDRQVEGTFQWLTGESVFYTNWEPGQPDDGVGNEDAVFMWPLSSPSAGQWGDSIDTFDFWAYGVVEVVPPIAQIQSGVNVSWTSLSNINYQVQYSTVLASNTWVNLGAQINATGTNSSVFDAFGVGGNRFYRIVQVP
jgi:hypothetical protein